MEATREVQRIEEFSKGATGWASWALDYVVKGSLVWGMSLLGFGKAAGETLGDLRPGGPREGLGDLFPFLLPVSLTGFFDFHLAEGGGEGVPEAL